MENDIEGASETVAGVVDPVIATMLADGCLREAPFSLFFLLDDRRNSFLLLNESHRSRAFTEIAVGVFANDSPRSTEVPASPAEKQPAAVGDDTELMAAVETAAAAARATAAAAARRLS